MSREIVSIHIEKTAGMSLESWYMKSFGRNSVLVYSTMNDTVIRGFRPPGLNPLADRMKTLFADTPLVSLVTRAYNRRKPHARLANIPVDNLPKDFDVIHGHFTADRFDEVIEDPFRTVILRNPLERMWSHYNYWYSMRGNANFRIDIPYDPKLTFEDFALLSDLQNYQTQALAGIALENFDLVGVTEDLDTFVKRLYQLRQVSGRIPSMPHLNRGRHVSVPELSTEFNDSFKAFHADDYSNYELARDWKLVAKHVV